MQWFRPIEARAIDTRKPVLEYNVRYRRWEWFGPYDSSKYPREAGFYWSPEDKCWMTPDGRKAMRLIKFADIDARARLLDKFAAYLSK